MAKIPIKQMLCGVGKFLSKNSPKILTGIGIVGMVSAVGLAVEATVKAKNEVDEIEAEMTEEAGHPVAMEPKEIVKTVWKYYIPTAAVMAASGVSFVCANTKNTRLAAAAAAAQQITEAAFSDYREKVVDIIGEKRERSMREELAAEKVKNIAVQEADIVHTGFGESIFYDPMSSRFFASNKDRIELAVKYINDRVKMNDSANLNEFYDELSLSNTLLGDYFAFYNKPGKYLSMSYGYGPTKDGRSCIVLDYDVYGDNGYSTIYGTKNVLN